jgi:hypothetical protein
MAPITMALVGDEAYPLLCSGKGETGTARLRERGLTVMPGPEVVAASVAVPIGKALEEAVRRGVPREAARAVVLGHAQVPLAIASGALPSPFSDAAEAAIHWGAARAAQPKRRRVLEPDQMRAATRATLRPEGRQ